MKYKLLFIVSIIMMLTISGVAAANQTVIMDINSSNVTEKNGVWEQGTQVGFKNIPASKTTNGRVVWAEKSDIGSVRVSFWVTLDEDGASDAVLKLRTEYLERVANISFNEGYSGWVDFGYVTVTGAGLHITFESGSNGNSYVSAVKVEYLGNEYKSYERITKEYPEHIIFGNYSDVGFLDGKRIEMKGLPRVETNNAYVTSEALSHFFGVYVQQDNGNVSFTVNGTVFSGSVDGENFTIDGKPVSGSLAITAPSGIKYNITEVARNIGKNIFISNKGLVMISDKTISMDEKTDKLLILDVLSALRNE